MELETSKIIGDADEVYWLLGYLKSGASREPEKYAKAYEAVTDFKSDVETKGADYDVRVFRGFVKGLFAGGIIEIEDLDDIDKMIAERSPANKPNS